MLQTGCPMPNLTISPHWEEVLLFSMYDKPLFVNWGWLLPSRGGLLIQTWLYPKWVCVLQNIAIICNHMCWPVPKSPLSWSRQSSAWEAFLDSSKPWILELHEVKPLGGSWIIFLTAVGSMLVGGIPTPLKNMKVSWDDYSQYIEK